MNNAAHRKRVCVRVRVRVCVAIHFTHIATRFTRPNARGVNTWQATPIIALALQISKLRAYKKIRERERDRSNADSCSEDVVSISNPPPTALSLRDHGEPLRFATKTALHSLAELSPYPFTLFQERNYY